MNVPHTVNRFTFDGLNWDVRVVVERDIYKDFFYEFAQMDIDALFDGEEMRVRKIDREARKMHADFLQEFQSIDGLFDENDTVPEVKVECLYHEDLFKYFGDYCDAEVIYTLGNENSNISETIIKSEFSISYRNI